MNSCLQVLSSTLLLLVLSSSFGNSQCPGDVVSVRYHSLEHSQTGMPVRINEIGPYEFLLDTGAQLTVVEPSLAAELRLSSQDAVGVISVTHYAEVPVAIAQRVEVGRAAVQRPLVAVENLDHLRTLLIYLLSHAGHLVSKNQLLEAVWGDAAVTDNSLTRAIALLRRVLEDDPRQPHFIETVSTGGYRFICPVKAKNESWGTSINAAPSSSTRFPSGATLGGYQIVAPLGVGGMGEVYRARDVMLKREVAIKVIPEPYSSDPDRLHRFRVEAEAAAALNHPNIVTVHNIGRDHGMYYIVSELLQGETLRDRLRAGPLPVDIAIGFSAQIARGLAAAHQHGIVHRDLKPENIFVIRDGRIKILDFGLAKLTEHPSAAEAGEVTATHVTEPGTAVGTAAYMAPEQVRGNLVDHRADIFALGVVLYEMLTRRQAFARLTPAETMTAVLNDEPPPLSQSEKNISPGLQRILFRCLEKDQERRFQSASDFVFALEPCPIR